DRPLSPRAARSRPRGRLVRPVVRQVEARCVLVDVDLAVEAEVVGVRAQEAAHVGVAGERVEVLLLERPDVLRADLRRELDLGVAEPLALARRPQAVADLEHGLSVPGGAATRKGRRRSTTRA